MRRVARCDSRRPPTSASRGTGRPRHRRRLEPWLGTASTAPPWEVPSNSPGCPRFGTRQDRKSTRLNSSHGYISYAVFCLKKKKKTGECVEFLAAPVESIVVQSQHVV